jgi:hypothetical protein
MSIKDLDVSDPSKLSDDQLLYARDRRLISDEQFDEHFSFKGEVAEGVEKPLEKMNGQELKEKADAIGFDWENHSPKPSNKTEMIAAIRSYQESTGTPAG